MSKAFVDRSQQNNSEYGSPDSIQKKTDPIAQLKWIENALKAPSWNASAVQPAQRTAEEEKELQMKRQPAHQWSARNAKPAQRSAEEEQEMIKQRKQAFGKHGFSFSAQRFTNEEEPSEERREKEGEVQMKPDGDKDKKPDTVASSGSSTGLPDSVKAKMESAFNTDFSSVKVCPNSNKASEVGALAYTQGSDIHFAPGQYTPESSKGQELLAHELTHVVQQREGRVQPTQQIGGMPINDSLTLEKEADTLGAQAAQGKMANVKGKGYGVQMKWSEAKKERKFQEAKQKHDLNNKKLKDITNNGVVSTTDPLLTNSCEAITRGIVKLFALTKTGDSDYRIRTQNKNYRKQFANFNKTLRSQGKPEIDAPQQTGVAYFPNPGKNLPGHINSTPVYYDHLNIDINTNIHFHRAEAGGFADKGYIAIVEPSDKSDTELNETVKHEMQHAFDKHGSMPIERYKSEYRAYSYANSVFTSFDNIVPYSDPIYSLSWNHRRQFEIFNHIKNNYKYASDAWDDLNVANRNKFRNDVIAYADPDTEGVNKLNSIRINYFHEALTKIKKENLIDISKSIPSLTSGKRNLLSLNEPFNLDKFKIKEGSFNCPKVQHMIDVAFHNNFTMLNKEDAQYILKEGASLRNKIGEHLLPDAYMQVMKMINMIK